MQGPVFFRPASSVWQKSHLEAWYAVSFSFLSFYIYFHPFLLLILRKSVRCRIQGQISLFSVFQELGVTISEASFSFLNDKFVGIFLLENLLEFSLLFPLSHGSAMIPICTPPTLSLQEKTRESSDLSPSPHSATQALREADQLSPVNYHTMIYYSPPHRLFLGT